MQTTSLHTIFKGLLFIIFSIFSWAVVVGQTQKTLDSLKQEASLITYSNPNAAIKKGEQLYSLATNNPSIQVSALIIIANGYAVLKNHDKVLEYASTADSIAQITNNYTDRIRVLGFIGGQYQRLKLRDKALEYLDEAYTISVQHPLPDSLQFLQGNILFVKGLIQKDNLGCTYALPVLEEAAIVFKNNISSQTINASIAIAQNNIGDCYIDISQFELARQSYLEAKKYATRVNSVKSISYAEIGLAKILALENKYQDAITLLQKAKVAIAPVNDLGINTEIYKALAANYKALQDFDNATLYTNKFIVEEEKLMLEEKKSLDKVAKDLTSKNFQKREEQQNLYYYIFIGLGILLSTITFLIVRISLKKRRKIQQEKENV